MLLMILVACATQPVDNDVARNESLVSDFSSYESPCLDGLAYNMRQRNCTVEVVDDGDGKKRYYCRFNHETSAQRDVWTTRSFASWESGSAPSAEILKELDYYPACSDWSLEIFYRQRQQLSNITVGNNLYENLKDPASSNH